MKKLGWICLLFPLLMVQICRSQQSTLNNRIDSLVTTPSSVPFNGVIRVVQRGKTLYSKTMGLSDLETHTRLKKNDQFIIGSISKQITATLVLREYEQGRIQLNDPIGKYLPQITQPWADSVTVSQLLYHMHGIVALDQPTSFTPGTQFNYAHSNLGYLLLSKIIEKTSGKSFVDGCMEIFKKCGMKNSFHPDFKKYKHLVNGYTEQENNSLALENNSFQNAPAAGGLISTAEDLVKWNQHLHQGKLLQPSTYQLMTTIQPGAIRDHPIFGITEYGYGITVSTQEGLLQLGQTGFAPGFVSMNFYFPATQTSVIVLENIGYQTQDLKKTFYYHTHILEIVKNKLQPHEK
jgi:D-alanyl-D-alanine carboxypeptidase